MAFCVSPHLYRDKQCMKLLAFLLEPELNEIGFHFCKIKFELNSE